nr:MAG TPA: hypothetical protein [Caudoviricetes sp.]
MSAKVSTSIGFTSSAHFIRLRYSTVREYISLPAILREPGITSMSVPPSILFLSMTLTARFPGLPSSSLSDTDFLGRPPCPLAGPRFPTLSPRFCVKLFRKT